ncbi:MAG: dual specificity protein phosphatase family protein [Candidatus Nitrosocaldus sp.]|nr:dual specificity protein phosphatase family protein [Candidatus Nitrosocaldus sp.]MDW8276159.1 dual specificity protein phosphatase family protein [Candidatus Nitrosocaldus sp.]
MSRIGDIARRVHGRIFGRPQNFSWVVDGMLAGSARPMSVQEMEWVKQICGIRSIVSVIEEPLPDAWLDGIEYLHIPTLDGTAPDIGDMDRAVEFIRRSMTNGRPVLVHCAAGKGRTGTILAAYMIKYEGLSAVDAIGRVRSMRPGSIQSSSQEMALLLYERYIRGGEEMDE